MYENPSDELRQITKSADKHNKFSESVFAYLDGLMRYKLHIKTLSAEAYVMFATNNTHASLDIKDSEEVNIILKDAYQDVDKTREAYKRQRDEIIKRKETILQEKLQKAQEARRKKEAANLLQTNYILFWGLWQRVEQIDAMIGAMKDKEKLEVLMSQIRFRKNILHQASSNP